MFQNSHFETSNLKLFQIEMEIVFKSPVTKSHIEKNKYLYSNILKLVN